MDLEVQVQEPVGEPPQVSGGDQVFKPGEGGLGGQVANTLGSLAGHDLEGGSRARVSAAVLSS